MTKENYRISSISILFDFECEYVVNIRLNAMSSNSYNFWEIANDQLARDGSMFDSPFAPINGNIKHINGERQAFGYFHTYASSDIDIYFDRSNISGTINIPGPYQCFLSCTKIFESATFEDVSEV